VFTAPGLKALRRLELHACEEADAVLERLLEAPLLAHLTALEVSESLLSDAGAALLSRNADRLKHLESLRIDEVPASQAALDALVAQLPQALANRGSGYDSVTHFADLGEVDLLDPGPV
jgi:hypothetical protein